MLLLIGTLFAILLTITCYFLMFNIYLLIIVFISSYLLYAIFVVMFAYILSKIFKNNQNNLKPKKIFEKLTFLVCRALMTFYRIKIIKKGFDKLEEVDNFVLISNHQSNLDPLVTLACIKNKKLTFIMKQEIMKVMVLGSYLSASGFFPLNRVDNREGLKTILNCVKALEHKRSIGVYIEGTRSLGSQIQEFKPGALKMAYKSKSDIVVNVIDNTYKVKKRFPFLKTKVLFKICNVFKYEDYKDLTTKELETIIKNLMEENLKEERNKNYA